MTGNHIEENCPTIHKIEEIMVVNGSRFWVLNTEYQNFMPEVHHKAQIKVPWEQPQWKSSLEHKFINM